MWLWGSLILLFFCGCEKPSAQHNVVPALPCLMMRTTTWFLPSGKKDWWHIHAASTLLAECDSVLEFEQINACYVNNKQQNQLSVSADLGSYDRSTTTIHFRGNVSTKITLSKS
jgi:hypothetical protein